MCLVWLFWLAAHELALASVGEDPGQTPATSDEREKDVPGENNAPAEEHEEAGNVLDRHKQFMDTQVQRASQWVDGFFANSNDYIESSRNQFRLRPEFYYRDEQGTKLNLKVRARLELPELSRRLSFVAGSDGETDPTGDFTDDSNKSAIAGLQFLLSDKGNWHTSIVAGAKFNNFAFFLGPRFRYQNSLNDRTMGRFTQTFRWQTNNHWDIGSRGDLYYVLNERLYFRQTLYGRWRGDKKDKQGLEVRASSVLSQRLSLTAGLQYDFTMIAHTKPDTHIDEYTASLRYRKQTRREWLYYEIAPQVSFEEQFDYKANPGIRLRLELYYGQTDSSHFWEHDSGVSDE